MHRKRCQNTENERALISTEISESEICHHYLPEIAADRITFPFLNMLPAKH